MGYLNNQLVTIDAILTKKGRELLARGDGSFNPTQFALADDEIDYNLYNTSHPSGSAYYGEAIENMPLLEAFPDEKQVMKYKLTTLPRGTAKMPILSLGQNNITLKQTAETTITPQTLNYTGNEAGYTFIVSDSRLFRSFEGSGLDESQTSTPTGTITSGTNVSKTVIGTSLSIQATGVNTLFGNRNSIYATLTVIGRTSGARIQIPIEVTRTTNS